MAQRGAKLRTDSILWPLFHYHPGEISFDESAWQAYREANLLFAKAIANEVSDGDMVWVHDYHLMLLPAMLREEIGDTKKNIKIGFFLHTPFPSSEIYRILPVRNEVLLGVLHCDLLGFHTYDYARHFLSSCSRILYAVFDIPYRKEFGSSTNIIRFVAEAFQRPPTVLNFKARLSVLVHSLLELIPKSSSRVSKNPGYILSTTPAFQTVLSISIKAIL